MTTRRRPTGATLAKFATACLVLAACGSHQPGGMTGPTISGKMNNDEPPPHPMQSNDILKREARTSRAMVSHVLIAWKDLADYYGDRGMTDRAKNRSKKQAEDLVKQIYAKAKGGDAFESLMSEYSDDLGSSRTGEPYEVKPGNKLVLEYRRMGLRMDVGEIALTLSPFGWHVLKRVE